MRILFFGNHTVGVRTLDALSQSEEIVGVVAHPPDPEDGTRYESLHGFAVENGWRVIRSRGADPALELFIRSVLPDLIWITDYRYILPPEILNIPRQGAVNLHPSLLPKYRGRAPINWAIINGETRLGVTAHFVDSGVDSGDIIDQAAFDLRYDQDVSDALSILYPMYGDLARKTVRYFRSGNVPRTRQDHAKASTFPRRKPEDGLINWNAPVQSIWNLVRGVAHPYPGAFTTIQGQRIIVWKAAASFISRAGLAPGRVIDVEDSVVHVQCHDGALKLLQISFADEVPGSTLCLSPGNTLGT